METIYMTAEEIIKDEESCPLPLSVISNYMGINLCSVKGVSWQKQKDGQLISVKIYFIPNNDKPNT